MNRCPDTLLVLAGIAQDISYLRNNASPRTCFNALKNVLPFDVLLQALKGFRMSSLAPNAEADATSFRHEVDDFPAESIQGAGFHCGHPVQFNLFSQQFFTELDDPYFADTPVRLTKREHIEVVFLYQISQFADDAGRLEPGTFSPGDGWRRAERAVVGTAVTREIVERANSG